MTFFTINFLYHLLKEICTFCMCKFQCLKVKSVKRSWVWLDYLEVICGSRRNGNKEYETMTMEQPWKDLWLLKLLL